MATTSAPRRTVPAHSETLRVSGSKQSVTVQMDEKPIARGAYQTAILDALLAGDAIDGFSGAFAALRPQRMSVASGMVMAVIRNMTAAGYQIERVVDPAYPTLGAILFRIRPGSPIPA